MLALLSGLQGQCHANLALISSHFFTRLIFKLGQTFLHCRSGRNPFRRGLSWSTALPLELQVLLSFSALLSKPQELGKPAFSFLRKGKCIMETRVHVQVFEIMAHHMCSLLPPNHDSRIIYLSTYLSVYLSI